MQIAPGVRASDWKALKLDDPDSPDWAHAIEMLEGRIDEGLIEPVVVLPAKLNSQGLVF